MTEAGSHHSWQATNGFIEFDWVDLQLSNPGCVGPIVTARKGGTTVSARNRVQLASFALSVVLCFTAFSAQPARAAVSSHLSSEITNSGTQASSKPLQPKPKHLDVTNKNFHDGIAGTPYLEEFTATGGTAPLSWSANGLPEGLSMSTDGLLSGTPIKVGTSNVTVTVTDAAGGRASLSRNLKVPTTLPAGCIYSSCAELTPTPRTVQVPADKIVGITRNATTGGLATVTLTALTVAGGTVLVLAPAPAIESGAIVYVNTVKANSDGTSTASVTPTTPADAYSDGAVKSIEPASTTMAAPALSIAPASMTTNVGNTRGKISQLALVQTAAPTPTSPITCDNGVSADLKGLSVTPQLTPALTAIWKHPIAGGGGVYVGTGGLSLFQADLDGSITLDLGVSVSGQGTCTLTAPEVKTLVPAGDLGAVVLAAQPSLKLTVSGKLDLRTSVTLKCSTEYRWELGVENRLSYCKPSNQPLTLSSDSGIDEVLTATIDSRVTIDDITGITGQLNASVHAGYHPANHPIAFLDASADYELKACLACLWPHSPATVTVALGTFFNKRIAVWDTPPPPVPTPTPIPALSHLVLSPTGATIPAGSSQTYSAAGFDSSNSSLGDVTASTTFSIAPDGSCTGAVCTASIPGTHTVTAVDSGVTGTATLNVQSLPQGLTGVESITLDLFGESVYAVKTDGTVWAWGANTAGKLGNGTTTNSTVPVQVAGLTGVRNVLANGYSAVALKTDGTVWAWGNNGNGELGNGTMTDSAVPVQVTGLTGAQSIAFANATVIAVKADKTVWAWGDNSAGQLGNGTASWPGSSVPVQVTGLSDVQNVTIAEDTPLAVKTDGTVWAWGSGANGLLGNGATSGSSVPVQVNNLTNVQSITTNGFTALALKTDGTVWAWGHTNLLGNGDTTGLDSSTPAQITGLTGVKNVTAQGYSAFAVKTDGSVWAWGAGPTGSGSVSVFSAVPVQVPAMTGVQSMACDGSSAFAVKTDGTVWAWGSNLAGVLGIGNTNESFVPVQVTALSGVQRITTGNYSAFAVKNDGTVWAWGANRFGQLGIGSTIDSYMPVRVG